jgi:hypothetical protein
MCRGEHPVPRSEGRTGARGRYSEAFTGGKIA